ncbi:hypothetical protein GNZ18_16565 [Actinomadura sp. NEAU-AAG5]|uniref:Uncharacterized protein n=2 Tax=Actinomadura litoris TaxID=2678616 RepID=A0A7K1L1U8_9ACTN|nr:hypothetical protein [Actinomadura litoris]
MQPNPPQPGFPQYGQPPMPGGPAPRGGGPGPFAGPPKPRANAAAAMAAGNLALLSAGMLIWFALYNIATVGGSADPSPSPVVENVVGGAIGAGLLFIAAALAFARRIAGVWALYALCMLYVVAILFVQPLGGTTTFGGQLKWLFGFQKGNGAAMGMTVIFSVSTAIMAAIAGTVKSQAPTTTAPPRP